jgi:hypothetical protein
VRLEYLWFNGAWALNARILYVYDGNLVVQERLEGQGQSPVNYTRGLDLSGTRQGAGGIGGLLARSHKDNELFAATFPTLRKQSCFRQAVEPGNLAPHDFINREKGLSLFA